MRITATIVTISTMFCAKSIPIIHVQTIRSFLKKGVFLSQQFQRLYWLNSRNDTISSECRHIGTPIIVACWSSVSACINAFCISWQRYCCRCDSVCYVRPIWWACFILKVPCYRHRSREGSSANFKSCVPCSVRTTGLEGTAETRIVETVGDTTWCYTTDCYLSTCEGADCDCGDCYGECNCYDC